MFLDFIMDKLIMKTDVQYSGSYSSPQVLFTFFWSGNWFNSYSELSSAIFLKNLSHEAYEFYIRENGVCWRKGKSLPYLIAIAVPLTGNREA